MSKRLFSAPDDVELLLMVRRGDLRRLDLHGRDIPAPLDAIIRKALAVDLDERFSSARCVSRGAGRLARRAASNRDGRGAARRAPARARERERSRCASGPRATPSTRSAVTMSGTITVVERQAASKAAELGRIAFASALPSKTRESVALAPFDSNEIPAPDPQTARANRGQPVSAGRRPRSRRGGRSAVRDRACTANRSAPAPQWRAVQGSLLLQRPSRVRPVERARGSVRRVPRAAPRPDPRSARPRARGPRSLQRADGPGAREPRPGPPRRRRPPARRPGGQQARDARARGMQARTSFATQSRTPGLRSRSSSGPIRSSRARTPASRSIGCPRGRRASRIGRRRSGSTGCVGSSSRRALPSTSRSSTAAVRCAISSKRCRSPRRASTSPRSRTSCGGAMRSTCLLRPERRRPLASPHAPPAVHASLRRYGGPSCGRPWRRYFTGRVFSALCHACVAISPRRP